MSNGRVARFVGISKDFGISKDHVRGMLGLAGSMILASCLFASAQDAAPPAPTPAAPICPTLLCLIAPHAAADQQAAAQPAPVDPQAPQANPQAQQAATPVASESDDSTIVKHKPKPKPVVTIAAEGGEIARMKTMIAAMPNEKIKIVAAPNANANTDFAIRTAFDPRQGGAEEAKLFTEQMHVVAGGAIHSLDELKGKVVSFGPDHSPSQVAARKAFEGLGIAVKETPLDLDNALDGLATGDIDAVVVLAPQPVTRLKTLSAPGLHLVAWPQGASVPEGAVAAWIDGGDYPALAKSGEAIAAIGVDAVLTMRPKGARAPAAKAFLTALSQHSGTLSKRGFDLLKADLDSRTDRRVASVERR